MVNTDPDDQQETLDAFSSGNEQHNETETSEHTRNCPVCDIRWPDTTAAKHCHPAQRLKREHAAAVTSPDDPHTGFVLPTHLSAELSELNHRVEDELREAPDANPLRVVADVITETVPAPPECTEAWHVFTHLVFLQQIQLLPGYPVSAAGETSQPHIQAFCNTTDAINGRVTDTNIDNSPVVTRDRVYRRKVLTTTSEFTPAIPVYDWATEIQLNKDWPAVRTNAVFNEGTAHNVLVQNVRNWLTKHPEIAWATAPHEVTAGAMIIEADTPIQPLTDNPNADSPTHPTYMFDFAGFQSDGSPPQLAVLGIVLTDHDIQRHILELIIMRKTHATGVIVVQSRDALIRFLKAVLDVFTDEPDPAAVASRYGSRPSIPAINEQLNAESDLFKYTTFVSVKQLVDEIVKPTEILGPALIQTEAEQ